MDQVDRGHLTRSEIFQQPATWPTTLARVREFDPQRLGSEDSIVITGAGTSAHAASAVAAGWTGARAIPSTELLIDHEVSFGPARILLSLARSGDSPESIAVVEAIQKNHPAAKHFAITCNGEGQLAKHQLVDALILDPRTNDRSLVMTSSFSNLVLGGLCLRHFAAMQNTVERLSDEARDMLRSLDEMARDVAARQFSRAIVLASSPLIGAAREVALKLLEMTAGRTAALAETYLGLRHGPMSFIDEDTLVLCFISSSPKVRNYEVDLLKELRTKRIGYVVAITTKDAPADQVVKPIAPDLPDHLRTPFEIVFPQLLGLHLSLNAGLDPDNPSPGGIINRVVQGVRIYD